MNRCKQLLAATILTSLSFTAPAVAQEPDLDPRIQEILTEVSPERLGELVEKLASFETRHTLSATGGPRGIGAARQWILEEMQSSSPRLQVSFDTYRIPAQGRIEREAELRNVMAVLPGKSERRVYVSGHYDSFAFGDEGIPPGGSEWDGYAPGANDDGSGTALTMELARVFAQSEIEFDATLVFIALAGEEEGLVGASLHAQKAAAENTPIIAVFNNDIVGNITGGSGIVDGSSVRIFSAGPQDSPSRQLARFIRRQAARYIPGHRVRLIAREDRFGRGGDHTAFNQNGFTGVRITESKENYSRQHTVLDTADGVAPEYLARNARVNAAGVATLALAPPAPNVEDEDGDPMLDRGETRYDARLEWQPSAGAIGYRVVWRDTWTRDWQHSVEIGNVTKYVMKNVSIDDYVFGVAAIGPDGNESLVSAYVREPRQRRRIEVLN